MLIKIIVAVVVIVVAIQFIPADKTNPPVDTKVALHADANVMRILKKSCYDCHSNETHWSVYTKIAPLSFGAVSHVKDGRKALNFSIYKILPKEIKIARLKRAISMVKLETMPLWSYVFFHPKARLSKEDKKQLVAFFTKELEKAKGDNK
jgi:hypothetical protein